MATQAPSTPSTLATAAPASPSAPALSPSSTHGFFKTLPRELRDNIYDLLVQEIDGKLGQANDSFTYYLKAPLVALRLVNHQCKLEYDERCSFSQHIGQLLIKDVTLSLSDVAYKFPALATRTTNMTLVVNPCAESLHEGLKWCYPGINLEWHAHHRIIDFSRQLPCLRCVRVYLMVPTVSCARKILPKLGHFTMHPKVIELKLFKPGCTFVEDDNDNNNIMATWTRQRGLEGDEEIIQQYLERAWDAG